MRARLNQNLGEDWRAVTNSRRSAVVAVQQAAQAGCRNYRTGFVRVFPLPNTPFCHRYVAYALVRSFRVVIINVASRNVTQMFLAEAHEMIQCFLLDALNKSFSISIHIGLLRANPVSARHLG